MLLKSKKILFVVTVLLIILLLVFPEVSKDGVTRGLIISSNVIIPSLFPFMVCVLILLKCKLSIKSKAINKFLYKIFGHNLDMFFVFLLSMVGGYPIGAKLLSELYNKKIINKKTANLMLMYCVNAGPAFVLSIANVNFNKNIAIILLASHLLSSIIIAIICGKKIKKSMIKSNVIKTDDLSFSEIFVKSVAEASASLLKICSFIVLFSSINAYVDYFLKNIPIIGIVTFLIEVTTGILNSKNFLFTSFLLGFSGFSIWFQIFSLSNNIKVNYLLFVFGRIAHGTLSVIITKLIITVFKVKISVFNNGQIYNSELYSNNIVLFVSMFIMIIILLIFIYSKNNSGKLLKDVV